MYVQLICHTCKNLFYKKKTIFDCDIKRGRILHFCMNDCKYSWNKEQNLKNIKTIRFPCGFCLNEITKRRRTVKRSKSGLHFCGTQCARNYRSSLKPEGNILRTPNILKINLIDPIIKTCARFSILNLTKSQLFFSRKNWQSARGAIRKNAFISYMRSDHPKECFICRRLKFDVAHIHPVSSFEDKALISEINNLNNLVALCKNHHIDYDDGLFTII